MEDISPGAIWDAMQIESSVATNFLAIFARFEYAMKRCGFLKGGCTARPNWVGLGHRIDAELTDDQVAAVFSIAPYVRQYPSCTQVVRDDSLAFSEPMPPPESVGGLLRAVTTTRNNLFHGGKFPDGPVSDPLRDTRLIQESQSVLLKLLQFDAAISRELSGPFWEFDVHAF